MAEINCHFVSARKGLSLPGGKQTSPWYAVDSFADWMALVVSCLFSSSPVCTGVTSVSSHCAQLFAMEKQVLSASSTTACDIMELDNSAVPLVFFLLKVLEDQAGVPVNLRDTRKKTAMHSLSRISFLWNNQRDCPVTDHCTLPAAQRS